MLCAMLVSTGCFLLEGSYAPNIPIEKKGQGESVLIQFSYFFILKRNCNGFAIKNASLCK
jgi:hypothetical protein